MDVVRIPGHGRPVEQPIGLTVARVAKTLERAFDDALAEAGGSRPTWLILLAVKSGAGATQAELARHVGISGATLVHHLDRLESRGVIARVRDEANRRPYTITLTPDGEAMFLRLRDTAISFDQRLRKGISAAETTELRRLLMTLSENTTERSRT